MQYDPLIDRRLPRSFIYAPYERLLTPLSPHFSSHLQASPGTPPGVSRFLAAFPSAPRLLQRSCIAPTFVDHGLCFMSTLLRSQCALSRSISYKGHDSEPDSEGDDKLPPPTESVGPPCRASRKRSRISISTERVASEDTVPSIENHAVTRTASQLSPVISSTIVSRSLPDPKRQMKNQEEPDLQSPLSPGVLARIQKSTHFIDHDDQGYGYDDQTPLPCEQSQSIEPQQTENSSANTGSFPGNSEPPLLPRD
ncbi:hypothetical protein N7454_003178 [Penicillium verhagenii]|nr:hypothetical protein N7454_003178 [Penicillium verhagenii]